MSDANIWQPDATSELVAAIGALLRGTSTTAVTIADTGTRNFTTQTGLYFRAGDWLVITKQTDPDVWMAGSVVSYNATTGALVFAPEVSSGSGSHSLWNISLSGVWVPIQWNGGIVGAASTFKEAVTFESTAKFQGAVTVLNDMDFAKTPTSTAGSFGLSSHITLGDVNAVLTPAQLFNTVLVIAPTAARVLTLPSAADIFSFLVGEEIGSYFDFTIINDTDFSVTIAGNSGIVQLGRTLFAEGSSSFRVTVDSLTIVSVANIGSPVPKVGAGDIDSSAVQSASADITLAANSPRLQSIVMTTEGNSVILPAATGLLVSSPTFVILNDGYYAFGIKDNNGKLLRTIKPGGNATLNLVLNNTIAGSWMIAGQELISGLLTYKEDLGTAYSAATPLTFVLKLTDQVSAHFAVISSNGLATFIYDNENEDVGAPATLSTTANMRVCGAFRINDDSYVVFYSATGATTNINAVVVTRLGATITVQTPAFLTTVGTFLGVDDNFGAPKIAQLDSTLYVLAFGKTVSGFSSIVAMQISGGVTCTWGTAVNTLVTSSPNQSQIVFPLTATTCLLLYKTGSSVPYTGKAVVVSVTNANPPVCTLGTAADTLPSRYLEASSAAYVAPNMYALLDDGGNANNAELMLITIAGTTVATNTTTVLMTFAGIGVRTAYAVDDSSRYLPKITRLSDTSLLIWAHTSVGGVSHVCVVALAFPAVTVGTILSESYSSASTNIGKIVAIGDDSFISVTFNQTGVNMKEALIIPHRVAGNTLTVGKPFKLGNILMPTDEPRMIAGVRLLSGQYALDCRNVNTNTLGGSLGVQLLDTNGLTVIDNGIIDHYLCAELGAEGMPLMNIDNRLVLIQGGQELLSPNTVPVLRLVNIDTVD